MDLNKFSQRLKDLMEEDGITRQELSLQIGTDRKCVRLWLEGKNYPQYKSLIKLAEYFHVRIDYLVGLEDYILETDGQSVLSMRMEEVSLKFSAQIRDYMDKNHLTIYAIAKKLHIDQKALKKWLVVGSIPETATLIKLSKLTNISIHTLLGCE
ncbi:MAG: XRE family transcriptional regulator [Clostridiales bacterium]|nr:XRE family transcriptional regulator [Clostridiales bacterium]MBE5747648.1 XRE family transcriptional regulator [Clostridiales bacterium]